ncbi:MAG: UDP-2,3-diacylglucosamine diphosphatase LpxI [Candidatus Aminicenantaceae bacterium]
MGQRIGIVAGSGEFPFLVLEEAKKMGCFCAVAGIRGEAETGIKEKADIFEWFDVGGILNLISFFKKTGVKEAVIAGSVDRRNIFNKEIFNEASLGLLSQSQDRSPTAIIKTIINFIEKEGIQIKDPAVFITSSFCQESILTETKPSPEVEENLVFGWEIAKNIADLDIGQTVIIKDKTVVAVEGIEGTDETIIRGGRLAGEEIVAIKVSRSLQDTRVDLPAVGLKTIEALAEVRGRALCFEAGKVPFFQKRKAVSLADSNRISIVVRKS